MRRKHKLVIDILIVCLSATIYAFNLNAFVHAGNLVPGGFAGLSVLLVRIFDTYLHLNVKYGVLYLMFNIPITFLVYNTVGKRFTLLSILDVALVSVLVEIIPPINITQDILLITVFGGICCGAANSLVLMAGACGGGTDFIAIYFSKKKSRSMWNYILFFNATLLLVAGYFYGWEISLYSIIFQFVNTQVIEMFDKRFKRSCFFVVTDKAEEIMVAIRENFMHNSTELVGIGSYSHSEKKIVYTIVGKYEQQQTLDIILSIDPDAFINIMDTQQLVGRFNQLPY